MVIQFKKSSVIRADDQCPSKIINQLIIPKNNAVDLRPFMVELSTNYRMRSYFI